MVQFGMAGECEDSVDNEADCGGVCGRGDHTKLFFLFPRWITRTVAINVWLLCCLDVVGCGRSGYDVTTG